MSASKMILSRVLQRNTAIITKTTTSIKSFPCVTSVSFRQFATNEKFAAREKVEEDRYMREQEKAFFETKKKEQNNEMKLKDQEVFQKEIAPVMVQVQELLKKSNDTISSQGLEAIARWKLQL